MHTNKLKQNNDTPRKLRGVFHSDLNIMINTVYYCLSMANILTLTSSQYDVAWEEELSKRDPNKISQILQCGIEGSNIDRKKK